MTNRGMDELIENTDHPCGNGTRLFGAPLQRLHMLKPPTGQAYQAAERRYAEALEDEKTGIPLHDADLLEKLKTKPKGEFEKSKDWFSPGALSQEQADRLLKAARQQDGWEQITPETLSDGTYFVAEMPDLITLDEAYHGSKAEALRAGGEMVRSPGLLAKEKADPYTAGFPRLCVIWHETKAITVHELIRQATGSDPEVEEREYACCTRGWAEHKKTEQGRINNMCETFYDSEEGVHQALFKQYN